VFEYLAPDEWRLDQQLKEFCESLDIEWKVMIQSISYQKNGCQKFFEGKKKRLTMEYFYRAICVSSERYNEGDTGTLKVVKWN
jgi:deoxyribodipyrimidine photolyase-related protein